MHELPFHPSAERFEDLPPDEQRRIVETSQHMHSLVYQYAVPITIGRTSFETDPLPVNNGSSALIRSASGTFAVTAEHVVRKVRERRDKGESVGLFLGEVQIPLPDRLHWYDSAQDLALLSLTENQVSRVGKWVYDLPNDQDIVLPAADPMYCASDFRFT